MTTPRIHLLFAALLATGCYSGLDSTRASGSGGDDAADDGVDDDAGDDAEPQREPTDPPPGLDDPFQIPVDEVELLPFHVRAQNLVTLSGQTADHAMFTELYARRYQLGDHDYANGIAPDLRWSSQKMETWVVALKPICNDPAFQAKYPTLVNDPAPLVRAAFARDPNSDELQAFADVQAGITDTSLRYRMVCLAVLTSLEFVGR
jgi:hypothetical protein